MLEKVLQREYQEIESDNFSVVIIGGCATGCELAAQLIFLHFLINW